MVKGEKAAVVKGGGAHPCMHKYTHTHTYQQLVLLL